MIKSMAAALIRVASFALNHRGSISCVVAISGGRQEFLLWLVKATIGWGFGLILRDLWRRAKEYL